MTPEATRPVRLEAQADAQQLVVGWADGHETTLSFEGLRQACPCAVCRGGHAAMHEPIDPVVFELPALMTYEVKELRPTGHYALQIVWGDGHGSGLFRWDALRGYDRAAPENRSA